MASLQKKNDSWHCQFLYERQRRTWVIGKVDDADARGIKARVEYLLRLIRQRVLEVPPGADIVTFLQNDGKLLPDSAPVPEAAPEKKEATFAAVRDSYLEVHGNGTVEKNTLDTSRLHLSHFGRSLGDDFAMNALSLVDLQRHVDRRAKSKNRYGDPISPITIKKEISTFSGVWNWARRMRLVTGEFPADGVRFPKAEESLPFMTWQEIERAIVGGANAEDLWEALYLTLPEIADLLAHVKEHAVSPFIYPMMCFAAHTGARRSEMIRAQVTDIDFQGKTVLIREKKRTRGKRSTRRVPLTPFLQQVLHDWMEVHPGGQVLFCLAGVIARSKTRSGTTGHKGMKTRASSKKGRLASVRKRDIGLPSIISKKESYGHFKRTLAGSRWEVLRGWHVLRHSFISACATRGADQRMLQEWCGHMSPEMSRRYAHLYPSTQQEAITRVFE